MSDITNYISAIFTEGCNSVIADGKLYQYDYGQFLKFEGLDLPDAYEVHFSDTLRDDGTAKTQIGTTTEEGVSSVLIPDEYLTTGKYVYAFIYLHSTEDDGETEYVVTIPVQKRPAIDPTPVTPEEQSVITQAIAALQSAVEKTEDLSDQAEESAETASNKATEASQSALEAEQSASSALESANNAAISESLAAESAESAEQSATSAQASAESAYEDAERAEQAAANAGYMFFYIDSNGDLIYQRTSTTQVDFYLDDGDLFVRANA